jgi:hypothetical protein
MRIVFVAIVGLMLAGCACLDHERAIRNKLAAPKAADKPALPPSKVEPASQPLPPKLYPCDCPNDRAKDGSRCGRRSAFCIPGGRSPECPGQRC